MAKLVDAGDSKSPAARCVGSSPTLGTMENKPRFAVIFLPVISVCTSHHQIDSSRRLSFFNQQASRSSTPLSLQKSHPYVQITASFQHSTALAHLQSTSRLQTPPILYLMRPVNHTSVTFLRYIAFYFAAKPPC